MSDLATTERMTADTFYEWCQQTENADRRCELIRREVVDIPHAAQHLCVDVVSPSNRDTEMNRKAHAYLETGVQLVWVVDPDVRNVQVFSQTEFAKHVDETETLTGNGVLPELQIAVADLFRQPIRA